MRLSYLKNKLWYCLHTVAPLGLSSCILALYSFIFTLIEFNKEKWLNCVILGGCVAFLIPWIITFILRWLPSYIVIPTPAHDNHPLNGKVCLSLSSLFEQEGDLLLSYNRNNIAGGLLINEGSKTTLNLMAQFMHRYFPASEQDPPFLTGMPLKHVMTLQTPISITETATTN